MGLVSHRTWEILLMGYEHFQYLKLSADGSIVVYRPNSLSWSTLGPVRSIPLTIPIQRFKGICEHQGEEIMLISYFQPGTATEGSATY